MMKIKRLAAALLSATLMVSLAACSGNNETTSNPESGSEQADVQEAVHLNLAESWGFEFFYTIITPAVTSSGYDITYYLTSFYDTLVQYDESGEVVGSLAEDWTVSDDGKIYTFNIKQGVQFSDGSDLTADDVAKSLLAVPVNLGQYNGGYGKLSTITRDAVVVDDYTVELHLTQPYYSTLRDLCLANPFGIVSSEQLNDDLTAKDSFKTATYGTGSYMYEGDNDGQTYNFICNPNYWGDKPDVDSFSVKVIPDNDAKVLALRNGEVDFFSGITKVSSETYEEMKNTEGFGVKVDEASLQTYYMGNNLSDPIFSDQAVREAMTSAIDKEAVVNSVFGGMFEKADTFFSRNLPYSMLLTLPFWFISMVAPGSILGLMLTGQTLVATQLTYFRIYMAILPLMSFIFMAMTLFPAIDKGLPAMIIGIARQLVFYVPVMLIVPKLIGVGGVYYGSITIDSVILLWTLFMVKKEFNSFRTRNLRTI